MLEIYFLFKLNYLRHHLVGLSQNSFIIVFSWRTLAVRRRTHPLLTNIFGLEARYSCPHEDERKDLQHTRSDVENFIRTKK